MMYYETEIPNPVGRSVYRQHLYLERLFGNVRPREYIWSQVDGLLFIRRTTPTDNLQWRLCTPPPVGSAITIRLLARARRKVDPERLTRGHRRAVNDPIENAEWLDWVGDEHGLEI